MPFSNKNNQPIICGRDYKAVPGDETQSSSGCPAESPAIEAENFYLSLNTTPKSDYESGVASETELIEEEKRQTWRSRRANAAQQNRASAIAFATVDRLAKVAEAEAEAEQQLLRVSTVSIIDDNEGGNGSVSERKPEKKTDQVKISLGDTRWKQPDFRFGSAPSAAGFGFIQKPIGYQRQSSQKSIRARGTRSQRFIASLCSRSMWRKRAKHFIPILLFLVYSASGGLMFWLLEGRGRQEKADRERAIREMKQLQARNETVHRLVDLIERMHQEHVADRLESYNYSRIDNYTDAYSNTTSPSIDLRYYVNTVVDALNDTFLLQDVWSLDDLLLNFTKTMTPLLEEHDRRDWTFWGSIFYCGTIYTTIGYGYMTANTDLGRALTIAYALLGIPLVLYNLSQLGRWLMRAIWKCYIGALKLINVCRPAKYRRPKVKEREREMSEFPFWIAISLTLGWTLMCSAIFRELENWDFFTSFYFFFQSLTTIGFGDVKPNHPEYLVWSFFLILVGLALVSMCWSLLQMKFDRLITVATKKIAEQFVHTELEESQMTLDYPSIENEIEKITAGENAFLANLVSEDRRQALVNEWKKKAKMKNTACQTDNKQENKSVQTSSKIKEISSQTPPDFLTSPSHSSTNWEVPYRETRRATLCSSATTTPRRNISNDEFRNLLQNLKTVIGECRETLSNKDLTTGTYPPMGVTLTPVRNSRGSARVRGGRSKSTSRGSTAGSVSMLEL